jgi:predicted glycosyltransferase
LSLHHLLSTKLGDGRVENMHRFYEQVTIQHEPLFDKLRKEFRKLPPKRSNLP